MSEEQQQQCALEVLEANEESRERGDRLNTSDIANLLPEKLENPKRHGDAYMLEMLADLERDRQREQDCGRTQGW